MGSTAQRSRVAGIVAVARKTGSDTAGAATVALLSAEGSQSTTAASPGQLSELVQIRIANLKAQVSALHLCAVGSCAEEQAWLWAADGEGRLVAVGLDTGEQVLVEAPGWEAEAGRYTAISALTGNATHLLAAHHGQRDVKAAPYKTLLDAGRKAAKAVFEL